MLAKMRWMVAGCLMAALLAVACGEDEKDLIVPTKVVRGTVGGCQIEQLNEGVRAAVMGQKDDRSLVEIASAAVDPHAPNFTITLSSPPPAEVKWVEEEDGTRHTEALVYTYIDKDSNEKYEEKYDGAVIGVATTRIQFFEANYEPLGALYGYNILLTDGGGYTQEFNQSVFVTAGGCTDDEEPTDGDAP
ncbi:MAG: hypothetical protein C4523_08425 [Myxococcales bacterium]|nr:MAG: hypothetical protein C4523_08425 [Myxococcales bacterium]